MAQNLPPPPFKTKMYPEISVMNTEWYRWFDNLQVLVNANTVSSGGGGGTPAGPNYSVQFDNGGAFGGDGLNFWYNPGSHTLNIVTMNVSDQITFSNPNTTLNNLLPGSTAAQAGQALLTTGLGTYYWGSLKTLAAGAQGAIQYSDGNGNFISTPTFWYDAPNQTLYVDNEIVVDHLTAGSFTISGLTPSAFIYTNSVGNVVSSATTSDGQLLIGNSAGLPVAANLSYGAGIAVINGNGTIEIDNTGVLSFQTTLQGLSPSAATNGAVTLSGVLGPISGGTGINTYNTGDTIYASASNVLSALPIGVTNQALVVTSGVPAWSDIVNSWSGGTTGLLPSTATTGNVVLSGTLIAANGGTGYNTYTVGDMLYADSTLTFHRLGIGASYQVITSEGGVPVWDYPTVSVTDVTNNQWYYPTFTSATTGRIGTLDVSQETLQFNPGLDTLRIGNAASGVTAGAGIIESQADSYLVIQAGQPGAGYGTGTGNLTLASGAAGVPYMGAPYRGLYGNVDIKAGTPSMANTGEITFSTNNILRASINQYGALGFDYTQNTGVGGQVLMSTGPYSVPKWASGATGPLEWAIITATGSWTYTAADTTSILNLYIENAGTTGTVYLPNNPFIGQKFTIMTYGNAFNVTVIGTTPLGGPSVTPSAPLPPPFYQALHLDNGRSASFVYNNSDYFYTYWYPVDVENTFSTVQSGIVSAPGISTPTTNYLQADGTWADPNLLVSASFSGDLDCGLITDTVIFAVLDMKSITNTSNVQLNMGTAP